MNYNRPELECKRVLEEIFPEHQFDKIRHPDFINPATGRALELDLYNEQLRLAVEYHGPQHYIADHHFNRQARGGFEAQQARDLFKEGYCRLHRITLIEVPNIPLDEIEKFIHQACAARGLFDGACATPLVIDLTDDEPAKPAKFTQPKKLRTPEAPIMRDGRPWSTRVGRKHRCNFCEKEIVNLRSHCNSFGHKEKLFSGEYVDILDPPNLIAAAKSLGMSPETILVLVEIHQATAESILQMGQRMSKVEITPASPHQDRIRQKTTESANERLEQKRKEEKITPDG
jgi:hypothetical protein